MLARFARLGLGPGARTALPAVPHLARTLASPSESDAIHLKRPPTAYVRFMAAEMKAIKKSEPTLVQTEVMTRAAAKYRELKAANDPVLKAYGDEASAERAAYEAAKPEKPAKKARATKAKPADK
jgi:hypothetical protein